MFNCRSTDFIAGIVLTMMSLSNNASAQLFEADAFTESSQAAESSAEDQIDEPCADTRLEAARLKELKDLLEGKKDKLIKLLLANISANLAANIRDNLHVGPIPTAAALLEQANTAYTHLYEAALRISELTAAATTSAEPRLSEVLRYLKELQKSFDVSAQGLGYTPADFSAFFAEIFRLEAEIKKRTSVVPKECGGEE